MVEDEVSGLTTLELMQRLAPLLPEGSFEQAQLLGVIKGLSTVGFSGQFGKGKAWEAGGEGRTSTGYHYLTIWKTQTNN